MYVNAGHLFAKAPLYLVNVIRVINCGPFGCGYFVNNYLERIIILLRDRQEYVNWEFCISV